MALYELRQYEIQAGKRDAWLKLKEEEIIPFLVSHGMVITGSFLSEDETAYVWMRRFESDHWKTVISPKVGELIHREKNKVQRIIPTRMSPSQ